MFYPQVEWPTEAALMLAPYNPGLHGSNSVGRRGVCQWGDHFWRTPHPGDMVRRVER